MEPSQILQWIVIGIIVALIAIDKAMTLIKRRSDSNPGNYGERIASLETAVEGMEEDIKLIKRKLNLI